MPRARWNRALAPSETEPPGSASVRRPAWTQSVRTARWAWQLVLGVVLVMLIEAVYATSSSTSSARSGGSIDVAKDGMHPGLKVDQASFRVVDVDVTHHGPQRQGLATSPHRSIMSSYQAVIFDIDFDQPVFFRGMPWPDIERFFREGSSHHQILGDAIHLECQDAFVDSRLSHVTESSKSQQTSTPSTGGSFFVRKSLVRYSTDSQSVLHTEHSRAQLLPLASASTSKLQWLRALEPELAASGIVTTSLPGQSEHDASHAHPSSDTVKEAFKPPNWNRVSLALLASISVPQTLVDHQSSSNPIHDLVRETQQLSEQIGAGSPQEAGVKSPYFLGVTNPHLMHRVLFDVEALESGRCRLVFPEISTSAVEEARTAALSELMSKLDETSTLPADPESLKQRLKSLVRRRLPIFTSRRGEMFTGRMDLIPHPHSYSKDVSTPRGVTRRPRPRHHLVQHHDTELAFLAASVDVAAKSDPIPFFSALLPMITAYISEQVTRRVPDYVKNRIRIDLQRRLMQQTISSELFLSVENNDYKLSILTELRSEARNELGLTSGVDQMITKPRLRGSFLSIYQDELVHQQRMQDAHFDASFLEEAVDVDLRSEAAPCAAKKFTVHFDTNKRDPVAANESNRKANEDVLKAALTFIKQHGVTHIDLVGHADAQGPPHVNEVVSKDRVDKTKAWFVSKGVPAKHVHTDHKGEKELLIPTEDDEPHPKNRRVTIVPKCPTKPPPPPPSPKECPLLETKIHFDTASYKIKNAALQVLQEVTELVKKSKTTKIELVGHTDAVGSYKSNEKLSFKRAKATEAKLRELGVTVPIKIDFKGEMDLAVKTQKAEVKNRRVTIRAFRQAGKSGDCKKNKPKPIPSCHIGPFNVYFGFDKHKLDAKAKQVLKKALQAYKKNKITRIVIEGHTDTKGSKAYNQKLSNRRAKAVYKYLKKKKVPKKKMKWSGKGELQLAVKTKDGVAEAKNRRVTVVLYKDPKTCWEWPHPCVIFPQICVGGCPIVCEKKKYCGNPKICPGKCRCKPKPTCSKKCTKFPSCAKDPSCPKACCCSKSCKFPKCTNVFKCPGMCACTVPPPCPPKCLANEYCVKHAEGECKLCPPCKCPKKCKDPAYCLSNPNKCPSKYCECPQCPSECSNPAYCKNNPDKCSHPSCPACPPDECPLQCKNDPTFCKNNPDKCSHPSCPECPPDECLPQCKNDPTFCKNNPDKCPPSLCTCIQPCPAECEDPTYCLSNAEKCPFPQCNCKCPSKCADPTFCENNPGECPSSVCNCAVTVCPPKCKDPAFCKSNPSECPSVCNCPDPEVPCPAQCNDPTFCTSNPDKCPQPKCQCKCPSDCQDPAFCKSHPEKCPSPACKCTECPEKCLNPLTCDPTECTGKCACQCPEECLNQDTCNPEKCTGPCSCKCPRKCRNPLTCNLKECKGPCSCRCPEKCYNADTCDKSECTGPCQCPPPCPKKCQDPSTCDPNECTGRCKCGCPPECKDPATCDPSKCTGECACTTSCPEKCKDRETCDPQECRGSCACPPPPPPCPKACANAHTCDEALCTGTCQCPCPEECKDPSTCDPSKCKGRCSCKCPPQCMNALTCDLKHCKGECACPCPKICQDPKTCNQEECKGRCACFVPPPPPCPKECMEDPAKCKITPECRQCKCSQDECPAGCMDDPAHCARSPECSKCNCGGGQDECPAGCMDDPEKCKASPECSKCNCGGGRDECPAGCMDDPAHCARSPECSKCNCGGGQDECPAGCIDDPAHCARSPECSKCNCGGGQECPAGCMDDPEKCKASPECSKCDCGGGQDDNPKPPPPPPPPLPDCKPAGPYTIYFDFDKYDIREDAAKILEEVAEKAKSDEYSRVEITGHTDTKGSHAYNDKLSKNRAESTKEYLKTKLEVPEEKMFTGARGERELTKQTGDEVEEQANRRVTILLHKNPSKCQSDCKPVDPFTIYFGFDKHNIDEKAGKVLENVAEIAKSADVTRIEVTGHTDTKGSRAYNEKLSMRRSNSAKEYLEKLGVPADKMQVDGKGERELAKQTPDETAEQANRRVTIVIHKDQSKCPADCKPIDPFIIYFGFDKHNIDAKAAQVLDQAAQVAKERGIKEIDITGHTDTKGSHAYNEKLSMRRATAARDYLQKKGIPAGNMKVNAKGETELAVQTGDEVKEARNRRVHVVLKLDKSKCNPPRPPPPPKYDPTKTYPDGCLTKPIIFHLIEVMTKTLPVSVTEKIVIEEHDALANIIAPSLVEYLAPTLGEAIPNAVVPMVATVLQYTVPPIVKHVVPRLVIQHTTTALTNTLTRGVVHVLAPTLSHTLRDAARVEPVCYYCYYVDPRYCYVCPHNRPLPQSAQAHLDLYTIDYFVDYYTDYYSDFYTGKKPLESAGEWGGNQDQ